MGNFNYFNYLVIFFLVWIVITIKNTLFKKVKSPWGVVGGFTFALLSIIIIVKFVQEIPSSIINFFSFQVTALTFPTMIVFLIVSATVDKVVLSGKSRAAKILKPMYVRLVLCLLIIIAAIWFSRFLDYIFL